MHNSFAYCIYSIVCRAVLLAIIVASDVVRPEAKEKPSKAMATTYTFNLD